MYGSLLTTILSSLLFRHWHHRVLLDPFVKERHVELREPSDFHVRNPPLTDHRVQGMHGEAHVFGGFLNGQKTLVHLSFSVDSAGLSIAPDGSSTVEDPFSLGGRFPIR